jgi:hypothetical protein
MGAQRSQVCSARPLIGIWLFAFLVSSPALAADQTDFVKFVVDPTSQSFKNLKVREEHEDGTLTDLQPGPAGSFDVEYKHKSDRFYDIHVYRIELSKDPGNPWPLNLADMGFTVSVLIRADENSFDLTIPIDIPRSATPDVMDQLDRMRDPFLFPQKLIIAAILFAQYDVLFGDKADVTQRAANIWFSTEFALASRSASHFRMTDDLQQAVDKSFPSRVSASMDSQFEQANSTIFTDINARFNKLIKDKQCDLAQKLIDNLVDLASGNDKYLSSQQITIAHLTDRQKSVAVTCGGQ